MDRIQNSVFRRRMIALGKIVYVEFEQIILYFLTKGGISFRVSSSSSSIIIIIIING